MDKPLVWLHGQVRTPPFSAVARLEAGYLLRRLQQGELPGLPHSRPMTVIGPRCHELRIRDDRVRWRIVLRIDPDAVVILDVFRKQTRATPRHIVEICRKRLRAYDDATREGES